MLQNECNGLKGVVVDQELTQTSKLTFTLVAFSFGASISPI